jgi:hypothetical protein
LLVPLLFLLSTAQGSASTIFTATLTGDQEVVATGSLATGTATLDLNDSMTALTYDISITGLDFTGLQTPATAADDLLSAHIHAPAPPGMNASVVFGFFGIPFSDSNPNDVVVTPLAVGVGGTIAGKWDAAEGNNTTLGAQLPNLIAGLGYLNFHTVGFPAGEIRGQILVVPEPSTFALLVLAVACVTRRCRRRSV